MRTKSVTQATILVNKFRKNGKIANEIIENAQSRSIPLMQKVFKSGVIGLCSNASNLNLNIIILQDGTVQVQETGSKYQSTDQGMGRLWCKKRRTYKLDTLVKTFIREKFYTGIKLDESAERTETIDNGVQNKVWTYYRRKSEFPQTRLAGNMRCAMIAKTIKDEYEGVCYEENYPNR